MLISVPLAPIRIDDELVHIYISRYRWDDGSLPNDHLSFELYGVSYALFAGNDHKVLRNQAIEFLHTLITDYGAIDEQWRSVVVYHENGSISVNLRRIQR